MSSLPDRASLGADAPSTELLAVARRFGLRPTTAVRLTGGYQNPTWLVRTRGGRPDVLRQYAPYRLANGFRNDRAILWEHALLRHLAAAGLPVIPPVPAPGGDTLISLGDTRWSRFGYVPGTPDVCVEDHHVSGARLLADIHLAARTFAPPSELSGQRAGMGERMAIADWFTRISNTPHSLDALFTAALDPAQDSEGQKTWFRNLDWLRLAIDLVQVAREDTELRGVLRQPIHGDYWNGNLAHDANGIAVVYDFDESALDLRVVDIAKFIGYSCQLPTGRFDLTRAEQLLAAYHEHFPLTAPELRHFVPALLSTRLFYLLPQLAEQIIKPSENHAWGWDFWGRSLTWTIAQRHELAAMAACFMR